MERDMEEGSCVFNGYSVTRAEIVSAALACLGWKFRHQARGENQEVDCVGLVVVVGRAVKYPRIIDVTGYRRLPKANVIREAMLQNLDEIPVEEARAGDVYLMRLGGLKPRHAAIRISDETNLKRGVEPQLIHAFALGNGGTVRIEPVRQRRMDIAAAFRLRGLVD